MEAPHFGVNLASADAELVGLLLLLALEVLGVSQGGLSPAH